jgi:hypothetical protein
VEPKLSEKSEPEPQKIVPAPQHWSSGRGKSKQLESVVTRPPKKVQRGGLRLVGWPTGSEAAMTHLNGSPDVPLDAEARDVPVLTLQQAGRPRRMGKWMGRQEAHCQLHPPVVEIVIEIVEYDCVHVLLPAMG